MNSWLAGAAKTSISTDGLELAGCTLHSFDAALLEAVAHGDALRTRHYEEVDPARSMRLNDHYMHAKLDLMKLGGQPLPSAVRRALRTRIEAQVQAAEAQGTAVGLELPVGRQAFSEAWEIQSRLRYALVPRQKS